ncbi:MAG TPA: DDE-type integrase/transposase/recombinase [Nitrososphaeraceae archaeon]|jgi:putative transposase
MLSSIKICITDFIIDETIIKVGSEYILVKVAIENDHREILQINISKGRNIFVAERFILNLVKRYGEHPVSIDSGTWYLPACRFLILHHHIHSSYEKSMIERRVQCIQDRTEGFDDYFLRRKSKCKLQRMLKWFNLFVIHYNYNLLS